jgi:(4S)-4-hydroxy-5-phosphonooxypentane-2,3-dione isomerase
MPKFAVIATVEITPGHMDEYLPLMMAHRPRCLKEEPGTLQFEVLRPREENKLLLYEVYKDEAAFQAHLSGPSRVRQHKEAEGMVVNMSGTRCTLLD